MKQGTMNILFFVLKTKLLKNGEAPVLMRITINGDYDDVRIQRSVPLNLWNAAKGCSKGRDRASVALNAYIAVIPQKATTITIILLFISILYYYGLMIYSQILIN